MTDQIELRERINRGEEAARLRDHPLMDEFFGAAERAIIEQWMETPVQDKDAQQVCRIALGCQQNLRKAFNRAVVEGKTSARELMELTNPTRPKRRTHNEL